MIRLQELIEENFKVQRSPRFYCDALAITTCRMNRITDFYCGMTIHQMVQDRIHQEAIFLLLETTMTAREISFELGVSYPPHLTRAFKRIEGLGPKEFRKR